MKTMKQIIIISVISAMGISCSKKFGPNTVLYKKSEVEIIRDAEYNDSLRNMNPYQSVSIYPKDIKKNNGFKETLRLIEKENISFISLYNDSTIVFYKQCTGNIFFKESCLIIFISKSKNIDLVKDRLSIDKYEEIDKNIFTAYITHSMAN